MLGADQRVRAGFTLVEILIATAAMVLVLLYTLNTFTVNRNAYVVIESVSEAHQNTLAVSGLLERDLRHAGYMVPPGAAACGVDSTTAPDTLIVSDTDAILDPDDPALAANFAGGNLAATPGAAVSISGGTATLALDDLSVDGVDSYDTDATPGVDSDFRIGGGFILIDLDDPAAGIFCGRVTDVDTANDEIDIEILSTTDGNPISVDLSWAVVPAHLYSIASDSLLRDGVVLARNVEDLQLAWFFDQVDGDGQIDANELLGAAGEPVLAAHAITEPDSLREVRVNLVLRTADPDPNDPDTAGMGQARENRTAASAPAADGRRRRVHTSTIRLRNVGA